MSRKWKILIVVTAILLIPILLGMTPLNFVQKIGAGCPFSQGKQSLKCNPCPFNSIISHEEHEIASIHSTFFIAASIDLTAVEFLKSHSITPNRPPNKIPLRC